MSIDPLDVVPAGHHKLNAKWAFWYQKKTKRPAGSSWHDGISCLGRFNTIEGFWSMYSHILKPDSLPGALDLMMFRDGIKPMWEDDHNARGGKFSIKFKKNTAGNTVWEEMLLALIGEQLENSADVCGVVMSIRYHDDTLSVWNRNADDELGCQATKDSLTSLLHLPAWADPEYSRHRKGGHAPTPAERDHSEHHTTATVPTTVDISDISSFTALRAPSSGPVVVNDGTRHHSGDTTTPSATGSNKGWTGWGTTKAASDAPKASISAEAMATIGSKPGAGAWGKTAQQPAPAPLTGGTTPSWAAKGVPGPSSVSSPGAMMGSGPTSAPLPKRAPSPHAPGSAVRKMSSTTPGGSGRPFAGAPATSPMKSGEGDEEGDGWQTVPMRR